MPNPNKLYRLRALVYPLGGCTTTAEEMLGDAPLGSGDAFGSVAELEARFKAANVDYGEPVRNRHFIPPAEGMYELIYEFQANESKLIELGFLRTGSRLES